MKKKIGAVVLACISITAYACQVVVKNDSDAMVLVTDLVAQSVKKSIPSGTSKKANEDPEVHADLRITIAPNTPLEESYRGKQIACSKSHEIPLTVNNLKREMSMLKC